MLTRKQQWRRTRVRRARTCAAAASTKKAAGVDELGGHERADSDHTTLSAWSSFDSLRDEADSCSAEPLARPPPAAERSVSFHQEVQVFLVTHKNELDTSAKQALWWSGRDAAINKRAWLHHLGQPGCGRQSAGRTRPQHQHQQHHNHHHHYQQDQSSHFLGAGRNTAAGRGRGGGALFAHTNEHDISGFAEETVPADATELLPADGVGILGCRCDACLTEGDESELDYEQQERLQWRGWRQHEDREDRQLPPRYGKPPPPYNNQPPPRYNEAYQRQHPSGGVRGGGAGRRASKSWPSPEDWDREDDLGGKGSRSYSPGSASGSSPLYEACEAYDDEGSYFFDG